MSRKILREYFNFSKKELNGIFILLIIILLLLFFPYIYQAAPIGNTINIHQFKKEIAEFEQSVSRERAYSYRDVKSYAGKAEKKPVYFSFDPNNLPEAAWKKLGLSEKQIKSIKNYEAKGGKFYRKEDVQKMYVITPDLYQKLQPYIQIQPILSKANYSKSVSPSALPMIDINLADSAQLQNIKGIGPAFASRIIRYRDRLGGFYSKTQLLEVYGVDSVHFAQWNSQIRLSAQNFKKININTAVFDDLKRHPYLNYKQLNAILQYRKQHGNYHDLQDLKKVVLLNDEILRKLEPYLIF